MISANGALAQAINRGDILRHIQSVMTTGLLTVAITLGLLSGCAEDASGPRTPTSTIFIGVDAGSSFRSSGHYDHALAFLSHYIYGHINALGGLDKPQALFIAGLESTGQQEPEQFRSLREFDGKSVSQIEATLKEWFPPSNSATDFNPFFREIARVTNARNLASSAITVLIITDGIPNVRSGPLTAGAHERYAMIDLTPLERISGHVTLRLAYISPTVGTHWRAHVPRSHVRLWTVDTEAMKRWETHLNPGVAPHAQDTFWHWLHHDIDVRIRSTT